MTPDEMKKIALARLEEDTPEGVAGSFRVHRTFDNIMNGTVVRVNFKTQTGEDHNLVHFGPNGMTRYRWTSDVLAAVSGWREPIWFFRFIELAGIGGVIAFFLILVFSILLSVLAFVPTANSTVLEVVKASFTLILGFFFGSQSAGKRAA
jgi:hypothetical protein